MAQPGTIKGGKIRVLLGDDANPIVYTAPCGFTSKTISLNKGLEEVPLPDCDNPDQVDWLGRDAVSLSMGINGEGVLATESIEKWLDAWESIDSVPAKVEWEFPAKTIAWTGFMHVETLEVGAENGRRATQTVSMQSDGEMTRVVTPAGP
ncbi:phage tail tube protein [Ochrobactrum quorumnocens]|uniref:Phage tail protein n=1 Tax=Ochrobactrum quorumnocens TaxID=271865 RepID=A0A5N1JZM1_9HYPH|nr:phage tail tube protein [[Ochrobactrum] quorumnocens]KAA9369562.1 hypothetical protein F3W84_05340 [[Ochrobactrum] quorumnocens]